jgi:hypothetical protein
LAADLDFVTEGDCAVVAEAIDHLQRMLNRLSIQLQPGHVAGPKRTQRARS